MDLLTKEEGLRYLQDVLGVPVSEVPNLSDNSVSVSTKLSFLEIIIRAFLEREPFQSICLMCHDVNSRRRPSWDEIKRDLLLGRGGLCYWLNAFMYALLSSVGFNASMTFSTYNVGIYCPNNHLVVLLHDVESTGSLHLVDVGLGYYIPRAISLDFTTESLEYTDSFMTYKFVRKSESMMSLFKKIVQTTPGSSSGHSSEDLEQQKVLHTGPDHDADRKKPHNILHVDQHHHSNKNNLVNETNLNQSVVMNGNKNNETIQNFTWQQLYFFNPLIALKDLESFFPCFDLCFSDITKLSSHSSPRAMCWPNGRFLALVNSKLIQEKEEGKLTKTSIVDIIVQARSPSASQSHSPASDVVRQKQVGETQVASEKINDKLKDEMVANGNIHDGNNGEKDTKDQNQYQPSADVEQLLLAYKQHFPQLPTDMVLAALKNWIATGTLFPVPVHLA